MGLQDDVIKAQGGSHDAFVRLIKACEPSMYRLSKSYVKTDADCADAIQETILKAFKALRTLREPQYFKSWLLRILINECNRLRKQRMQVIPIAELSEQGSYTHERSEQEQWLGEAVQSLEEELRVIVVLFYMEDMPLKEIAELIEVPEGTVKSRLYRAREKLSRYISQERSEANGQ
ncbi:sigma-70 family RNA polymerase sigma factor [Paenibacillus sp. NEAU-GSW1]|uniref:sigma-70 family RNA polymerase sigma factor n=1 Tax=Paenibacillus sp. NEAU-GSW1 TaxID=2682486 RepID=UPI0012E1A1E6|nr:sigma-70 family RNA polymerase sigma factor [Paenibacillus sp. NEAU-GSW1]MUT68006.1 sigma-70 family RNA polymerase sigma factor [Paenibacillus sp. NEAU-GSW1]